MDTASMQNISGIAIIGMGCRFPKAKTPEAFWQNLRDGVEAVTEFTREELLAAGVDASILNHPAYIPNGIVLEDVDMFDASFFGLSRQEAELTDPQHRIFLEAAWEALERAGYDGSRHEGGIGLYAGVDLSTYQFMNVYASMEALQSFSKSAVSRFNEKDFFTARVAAKLNLKGPAVTVQTTCSTSLIAIIQACQSLLNYQCDMALAGGSAITLPQKTGYFYQEGGISSPDGHCRAFDANARGTTGGSGAGVVVLKRLEDAIADGDHIEGIIRGFGINNDGSDKVGFTAPSIHGQAEAIAMAQAMAGVSAGDISYVEAHGTGTVMGDPIEVGALTQVFRRSTDRNGFCGIGSVKTNMGHCNSAAGVAGLIKTVLALKHKMLPPSLHFVRPNPNIDFNNSPFYVVNSLRPWEVQQEPRFAGVSSFGIGGTNGHVVLEQAPEREKSSPSRSYQLLTLSARTATALDTMCTRLEQYLTKHPGSSLADVAYTLQTGRKRFAHRKIYVLPADTNTAEEGWLQQQLQAVSDTTNGERKQVVFLFPGQGSQYVNMGKGLYEQEPLFRQIVDDCCTKLEPLLGTDLRTLLFSEQEGAAEQLKQTAIAQPALFVISYAMARLWMSWGIRPDAMTGHGAGKLAADCIEENLRLEEALQQITRDQFNNQPALQDKLAEYKDPAVLIIEMFPGADPKSELENIQYTLGQYWLSGGDINWKEFYAQESRNRVILPTYPFERKRYWMDASWKPDQDEGTQKTTDLSPSFYTSHWQISRHPSESYYDNIVDAGSSYLVFGHPSAFCDALVNNLRSSGKKVMQVVRSSAFTVTDESVFGIDPSNPDHYKRLFSHLQSSSSTFETILHLYNFKERSFSFESNIKEEPEEDVLCYAFYSLLYMGRALKECHYEESIRLEVVASGLHRFHQLEHTDPRKSLLSAACRLVGNEMPNLQWQTVDIDYNLFRPTGIQESVTQLLDELNYEITDAELILRNNARIIQLSQKINLPPRDTPVFIPGNTYLFTGTMNAASWSLSEYLMKAMHSKLVFTAVPGFPAMKDWDTWLADHDATDAVALLINRFREWQQAGLDFMVANIDMTRHEQVKELEAAIHTRYGRLNGIFHIGDVPHAMITDPPHEKSFTDPVKGIYNLATGLGIYQPDFIILCSFEEAVRCFHDAFARLHYNRFGIKYISICFDGIAENNSGLSGAWLASLFERVIAARLPQVLISDKDVGSDVQERISKDRYAIQN